MKKERRGEAVLPHHRLGGEGWHTSGKWIWCVWACERVFVHACVRVSSPDANAYAASFLSTGTLLAYRQDCTPESERWEQSGKNQMERKQDISEREQRARETERTQSVRAGWQCEKRSVGGAERGEKRREEKEEGRERKRPLGMESGISEKHEACIGSKVKDSSDTFSPVDGL